MIWNPKVYPKLSYRIGLIACFILAVLLRIILPLNRAETTAMNTIWIENDHRRDCSFIRPNVQPNDSSNSIMYDRHLWPSLMQIWYSKDRD
jgi:hypothetical protein